MTSQECSICCEPLSIKPIGTTSCGHPFHRECFRKWEAHSVADSEGPWDVRPVRCPFCNKNSKSFLDIYIDLSGRKDDDCVDGESSDDDSSCESDDEADGEEEEADGLGACSVRSDEAAARVEEKTDEAGGNDKEDIICIDDEEDNMVNSERTIGAGSSVTHGGAPRDGNDEDEVEIVQVAPADPPGRGNAKRSSVETTARKLGKSSGLAAAAANGESSPYMTKLKRRAKKLKRKVKMLQSRNKERHKTESQLRARHAQLDVKVEEMASELDEVKEEMEDLRESARHDRLELENERVQKLRAERERETCEEEKLDLKEEIGQLKNEKASIWREMGRLKSKHKEELSKADANSMSEVQSVLSNHKRLTQEHHELRQKFLREQQNAMVWERRVTVLEGQIHSAQMDEQMKDSAVRSATGASKLAKEYQLAMREEKKKSRVVEEAEGWLREKERKKKVQEMKQLTKKVSKHASRISLAATKAAASVQPRRRGFDVLSSQAPRVGTSNGSHHRGQRQSEGRPPVKSRQDNFDTDEQEDSDDESNSPIQPEELMLSLDVSSRKRKRFSVYQNSSSNGHGMVCTGDTRNGQTSKNNTTVGRGGGGRSTSSSSLLNRPKKTNDIRSMFRRR